MPRTDQWNMSADVARRVALGAMGFADPRPSSIDRRHMRRVMRRLGVIQLDSVPVVIRTQYMPFHSRLGPYDTTLVDRIAYADDEWFEAWSHEASLLPVEAEPNFRWAKDRARAGATWKGLFEVSQREPAYVQSILDEVRERGAVTGGGLSDPRPLPTDGTGWWSRSLGVLALDWLFRIGELGVRRQGNFEKVFSPLDSIIPQAILDARTPSIDDAQNELIVQSMRSLGVGTATDIADWYRLPIREVRARIPVLVEEGRIVPATVPGWTKPAFADPEAKIPRAITGATTLSPFDPVCWNRDRAVRLFDFEYRIEIYTPEAKRVWGYYVLPVMVDGALVARLDVKTDRVSELLRIKAAHAEPGCATPAIAERVMEAAGYLAQLVGVGEIDVESRGDLAPLLAAVRSPI
ncbi:MAG: winged helix-turn-helix domain-containing protein [Acidimicrobiales bacterium]